MTMPSSVNFGKQGPIELSEDDTHFLVRIHPEDRDRAKKIIGRQWDGDRKAWVFTRDPSTYEALVEEFQKDADIFNIRRPKTQRPIGIKPPSEELDKGEFDDQFFDDIRSIGEDIGQGQEKMYGELEQIREMLGSLRDVAANQTRLIEEVRGTQEETNKVLIKPEASTQKPIPKIVNSIPHSLDLEKQREIELLEKVLVMIACHTAKNDKSFAEWLSKYTPLRESTNFVMKTHQYLMKHLGKLVGEEDSYSKPSDLINKAQKEQLFFRSETDPYLILRTLNAHRNCFAHPTPNFDQWEEWSRSILYMMHLALVWSRVVIEEENSNG